MVFFTASPFPARALSVRALFIFLSFVGVLCGAALMLAHPYPGQPTPLAQVPAPTKGLGNSLSPTAPSR